jgi:cAMP phosphodiesterase
MSLEYEAVEIGKCYVVDASTTIEAFPTDHTVSSCGYIVSKEKSALLITADTYGLENAIKCVAQKKGIRSLVIECSFPSAFEGLAKVSKHLTPALLFKGLKSLEKSGLKLYINHIKPSYAEKINEEIQVMKGDWDVTILKDGDTIDY